MPLYSINKYTFRNFIIKDGLLLDVYFFSDSGLGTCFWPFAFAKAMTAMSIEEHGDQSLAMKCHSTIQKIPRTVRTN